MSKKKFIKPEKKKISIFFFKFFKKKLYGNLFYRKWDNFWEKILNFFCDMWQPHNWWPITRIQKLKFLWLCDSPEKNGQLHLFNMSQDESLQPPLKLYLLAYFIVILTFRSGHY